MTGIRPTSAGLVAGMMLVLGIVSAVLADVAARLPVDAPVQSGMERIRTEIIDHHTLITHRRLPVAMAAAFLKNIDASVSDIRKRTTVSGEARAVLDPLLTTIFQSARTIGAGGDSIRQMDALFAMTKALESYGKSFDHPGWKSVQARE